VQRRDHRNPARAGGRNRPGHLLLLALGLAINLANAGSGPPTLINSPTNQAVLEGEQVSFQVQADGTAPLSYQWQRNGAPLVNGTSSSYTVASAQPDDHGAVFSVTVSNALGQITSTNAVLSVRPGIQVTASLNQSLEPEVFRGWPMLLEVALVHPDASLVTASPILICATNGPWPKAVNLDVRDSQDGSVTWPFQSAPLTNLSLTLLGDSPAVLVFWLAPTETALLTVGGYELTATLNTTNVTKSGAWQGEVASVPVNIALKDEPATLSEGQFEEKKRLLASYALVLGDSLEARAQIDGLLAVYPENIGGLSFLARFLAANNQPRAALAACERALNVIAAKFPDAQEPPEALLHLRSVLSELLGSLQLSSTVNAGVLTLSWPAVPGASYRLESSFDLRTWTPRGANFTESNGSVSWTTPVAGQAEFFRLAVE